MHTDTQALLNIAVRAARKAGDIITQGFKRLDKLHIANKGPNDFVTNIDKTAEKAIIDILQSSYPGFSILAEEQGETTGNEYCWIIDPLDGTTNFIHGIPHIGISIALKHHDQLLLGVIYDPIREELFTAIKGRGAQLNNQRIRVSQQQRLSGSIIGGTSLRGHDTQQITAYLYAIAKLFKAEANIRFTGSAVLNFAYVAAGRLDGYWAVRLKPWDIAAGALLVQEAGGFLSDFAGQENPLRSSSIFMANPKIFKQLAPIAHSLHPSFKNDN